MDNTTEVQDVDLVDKKKVAAELLRAGMPVSSISSVLKVSESYVESVERTYSETSVYLTPADQEIANMMRDLAHRAYNEAIITLQFGSPAEKHSLVRSIIGRSMTLIGVERSNSLDQLRAEFQGLLSGGVAPELDEDEDWVIDNE